MKLLKRTFKVIVLTVILSVFVPSVLPAAELPAAQAATTVKINKSKLSLTAGKTYTLKITGTKKQVTWSSSNKKAATVSKTGKVTAVKAGKATITAKAGGKKYTCKVTVVKAAKAKNTYVTKAPFDAQEITIGDIKTVIPKDWTNQETTVAGYDGVQIIYPASTDLTTGIGTSSVTVTIVKTGMPAPDYSVIKDSFKGQMSKEELTNLMKSQLSQYGLEGTITDPEYDDFTSDSGTALKVTYNVTVNNAGTESSMTQTTYLEVIDNYVVTVVATDSGNELTPDVVTVAEYILKSIQAAK